MNAQQAMERPLVRSMVESLDRALGERLRSVVLYGSASRADFHEGTSDINLVVVTSSLDPDALEALAAPVAAWVKKGQSPPRLLTPALIHDSIDVFPIEFLDLRQNHAVLLGSDPFKDLRVRLDQLRLQCERELREKLMRLREGYLQAHDTPHALRRLLVGSYTTFLALFRGCLHLVGSPPPERSDEVVAAFCGRAGLDAAPFAAIDRLRKGEPAAELDLKKLFSRYYEQLDRAVGAVDNFKPENGGETR